MNYLALANEKIDISKLKEKPEERVSKAVLDLMDSQYVIDAHVHLFDIKCINKSYFILRFLKDFIGLKSGDEISVSFSEEEAYEEIHDYEDNWEDELLAEFENTNVQFISKDVDTKGVIDLWKAGKFLKFKTMKQVYEHYLDKFSLAYNFNYSKEKVLVTALMMDLEMGWEVKIKKSMYKKIKELKELSQENPILPFLFCDPRRADLSSDKSNLYNLFNYAFCTDKPFFGVKIYPALGYDPSDYRLWPIYKICEEYKIPVLTHCGGESVSTDRLQLDIYEGDVPKTLTAKKRTEMAFKLNDPNRWALVLKKFPNIKLNFGHFGGYETWSSSSPVSVAKDSQGRKECIFKFMKQYSGVYADFSYNLVEINLSKNLKNVLFFDEDIRERTLFGSDYWVVNKEGNLRKEQEQFIRVLKEGTPKLELANDLTLKNPLNYLFQ